MIHTPESKARISQAQQARLRHARESQTSPDTSRCIKCKQDKPYTSDFFELRTRKLVSGEKIKYLGGTCKKCKAEENAKRRAANLPTPEDYRRWNANRDPEHRKRYQREYRRMAARLAGLPERGTWLKYRDEPEVFAPYVSAEPLLTWVDSLLELPLLDDSDYRILKRARHNGRLRLSTADRICTVLGHPEQLSILYPS